MRATIIEAPHRMTVGEWDTPKPAEGEILISVRAAGICAGDLYFYVGKNPYARYPQVCGHEIAGVVAEPGKGVKGFTTGDRVVVEPYVGCGTCYPCRVGKPNCCARLEIIGVHRAGGYAEYMVAPAVKVHKFPDKLSFTLASFVEPIGIGVQACRRAALHADESVLVLGCGPIGLSIIEVASAQGARVTAVDMIQSRLDAAAKIGAKVVRADDKLRQTILEETKGEGPPVIIEATGNPQAIEQAVDLVASGGRIVIVGLVKEGIEVNLPGLNFTRKEMTVLGSRGSEKCFPESIDLLSRGAITYPQFASEYSMWDGPKVFADITANPGSVHKGVLLSLD
jgi:L-gulonate 5-dehydrogenase